MGQNHTATKWHNLTYIALLPPDERRPTKHRVLSTIYSETGEITVSYSSQENITKDMV